MAEGFIGEAVSTINTLENMLAIEFNTGRKYADQAFEKASAAIDALMKSDLGGMNSDESFLIPPPVTIRSVSDKFDDALAIVPAPGGVTEGNVPDPSLDPDYVPDIDPAPTFTPSVSGIQIPPSPGALDTSGMPTRPSIDMTIVLPEDPRPAVPEMDYLEPVVVPEFDFPTLPLFDAAMPAFKGTAIGSVLEWSEPAYEREILDDVLKQVRTYFKGGTGIPAAVEKALLERAVDREHRLVDKAVSEAFDEFSSRGYTMPPGALVARVDAIRQEALLKAQGASREVTIKAAEWEIENIRFAVQQGIACENVLVNIFLNATQRMFEAAKYRIESEIAVYNAQVALYNASQQAYATQAQVFKTRVDAELAKIEVFKAEIEGEKAKAQLNEQKVQVYVAQLSATQKEIDIYRAKMEAARVQSDLIRSQIDSYKADLEGYATRLNAEKIKFEAYETQVKAETAKAGIIDAEARAFAATIDAYKANADVEMKKSQVVIERNKLHVDKFVALVEKDKARMQAQLSGVQAAVSKQQALTAAYVAASEVDKAQAQLEVSVQEANSRNFLAYYEMQLRKYDAHMTRLIQKAQVVVEGLKSAGQISSALSAGAMSAMNIGAGVSGQAQIGAQYNEQYNSTPA